MLIIKNNKLIEIPASSKGKLPGVKEADLR